MHKMVDLKKWYALICCTFVFICVSGCADEDSAPSPVSTDIPASSDAQIPSQDIPLSSIADIPSGNESSSSVVSADVVNPSNFATTLTGAIPDEDGFYDIGDVYKAAPTTSKIAFVIRHSKREKYNLGQESSLTPIGIKMAQEAGKKLMGGDESFYYASTNFVRTKETCRNIAIGRGEENPEINVWEEINGGYFLTVPTDTMDALMSNRGGSSKYIAQWAYGVPMSNKYVAEHSVGYFYDLYERGKQFIDEVIVANMPNWKRVSILASHDLLVEPLIVYVTNRTIDLKVYESFKWVNYLSGIAVIVDDTNAITVLPIRGDEVGWMIPRDEVIEEIEK